MSRKLKDQPGFCDNCGIYFEKLSIEHVIFDSMFPTPIPKDRIVLRYCYNCNNGKSAKDNYLQTYLLIIGMQSGNAIAESLLEQKLADPEEVQKSQLLQDYYQASQRGPIDRIETSMGPMEGFQLPRRYVEDALQAVIRGLYRHVTKTSLPLNSTIYVEQLTDPVQRQLFWNNFKEERGLLPLQIGDGQVFRAQYKIIQEISIWLLQFYDSVIWQAIVNPLFLPQDCDAPIRKR